MRNATYAGGRWDPRCRDDTKNVADTIRKIAREYNRRSTNQEVRVREFMRFNAVRSTAGTRLRVEANGRSGVGDGVIATAGLS